MLPETIFQFYTTYVTQPTVTKGNTNKYRSNNFLYSLNIQYSSIVKVNIQILKIGLKFISEKILDFINMHEQHQIMFTWFRVDWNIKIWRYKVCNEVIFYLLLVLEMGILKHLHMHTRNHNYLVSDYVCILYKYSMLYSDGAMNI